MAAILSWPEWANARKTNSILAILQERQKLFAEVIIACMPLYILIARICKVLPVSHESLYCYQYGMLKSMITFEYYVTELERKRLSLSAFLGTEDIGVHIVHISRVIITYTLE